MLVTGSARTGVCIVTLSVRRSPVLHIDISHIPVQVRQWCHRTSLFSLIGEVFITHTFVYVSQPTGNVNPNVGLMLAQHRRWWPKNKPTSV